MTRTRPQGKFLPRLEVRISVSGSATNGTDYLLLDPVTIPTGATSTTIDVTPIDDALIEGPETVVVTLSPDSDYTIGSPSSATVTIADSPTVSVTATDPDAVEEGDVGPDPGTFTVTRTGDTSGDLIVKYALDGTATPATDYVGLSGAVTIPAGSESATIDIVPIGDMLEEGEETVGLTLSSDPAYHIGSPSGATVIIADNMPDLTITSGTPTVTPSLVESGGAVQVSAWTLQNQGGVAAGGFSNGYYLSTDAAISPSDIFLGDDSVEGLDPGASLELPASTLTIPADTVPGAYFVGILVDHTSAVAESDESNNHVSTPLTVALELEITGLPDSVVRQETLAFDVGLATATPVDLPGSVVTLSFTPNPENAVSRSDDPNVRFSPCACRTASFSIIAGEDAAQALPEINAGTIAGTIVLTATLNGEQVVRTIEIIGPPVIDDVVIGATSNGFNIVITGYASTLRVDQAIFLFEGTNLGNASFTLPVGSAFGAWFSSTGSIETGGSTFSYTQPVNVNGTRSDIRSVTVRLANGAGTSDPETRGINLP